MPSPATHYGMMGAPVTPLWRECHHDRADPGARTHGAPSEDSAQIEAPIKISESIERIADMLLTTTDGRRIAVQTRP